MSYLQSIKPDMKTLRSDIISGLSTGLFSIPEGMAYAKLAGVNPVYGLYSGIMATLVAALSTGTILMISTLTSAIAISTASVLSVAGIDVDANPNALFTITFLVGATMFVAGLLRLGKLVSFVSNAVMTGFVMGASLLIILGELGDFSGYDPDGPNHLAKFVDWLTNIANWDLTTTVVGIITLVMVILFKRIKRTEKMASIITLLVMTVIVTLFGIDIVLVGDIANIPSSLPLPMIPDFTLIPQLALGSVSVAIVALVQGAGISTAYPNPDKSKSEQSRDFVGEGLGNLVGSFFQSMTTGGSLSRTGISVSGGSRSRWGGVFAAIWLALIVLLFGDRAELVPMAVISGLLFVIGVELILARVPSFLLVHRTSKASAAALWLTFLSALFIPLQWTIFLGAGLSLLVFIYVSSQAIQIEHLTIDDNGQYVRKDMPEIYPSHEITIIDLQGSDFYAEVPVFAEAIPSMHGATRAAVIFRMRGRAHASSTGLRFIEGYAKEMAQQGHRIIACDIMPQLMSELERTETLSQFGREYLFEDEPGLTASLDKAVAVARQWLAEHPEGKNAPAEPDRQIE